MSEEKEGPVFCPVATLSFDQGSKDWQVFAQFPCCKLNGIIPLREADGNGGSPNPLRLLYPGKLEEITARSITTWTSCGRDISTRKDAVRLFFSSQFSSLRLSNGAYLAVW